MIPEITPELRVSPSRSVKRFLRRGKLGFEGKAIEILGWIENKRFQAKKAGLEKRHRWQLERIEKKGKRERARIEKACQQAEEFLQRSSQLLEKAKEDQERLPAIVTERGEQIAESARGAGMVAGKIAWEIINGVWKVGFAAGGSLRKGLEWMVEKIGEKIRKNE